MFFAIRNFLGIKSAEIKLNPITIIGGSNHQGKSSIIQAAAAAASGEVIPFEIPKKSASLLVHSGTAAGEVLFSDGVFKSRITYPQAERTTEGGPVEISKTAAGIESLIDVDIKERPQKLCEFTKTLPTKDDLIAALPAVPSDRIDRIYQTIELHGWDAAFEGEKKEGAKMKGAWQQITGQEYGSKKAPVWLPAAWESGLERKSIEKLNEEVDIYQTFYSKALQNEAIDEAEQERLQTEANKLPGLKTQYKNYEVELTKLFDSQHDLNVRIKSLSNPDEIRIILCPHCGQPVSIVGEALEKSVSFEKLKELRKLWDENQESLKTVKAEIELKSSEFNSIKSLIRIAEEAVQQLKPATAKSEQSHGNIEECKNRLDHAVALRDAFLSKKQADEKHIEITKQAEIVNQLAPNGLRQKKLIDTLKQVNELLKQLCKIAGWERVEINTDMSLTQHGTPYCLLSGSEKFRVRIALQIAIARIDGSKLVLIDAADILDIAGRLGLVKLVKTVGIYAVLGITYSDRDIDKATDPETRIELIRNLLPDLSKIGGNRYWVENGECQEIK